MGKKRKIRPCDVCGHPLPTLERRGVPMCASCLECEDSLTGRGLRARIMAAHLAGDGQQERRLVRIAGWLARTANGGPRPPAPE